MSAPRPKCTTIIGELAQQGVAIILISSDLPEVLAMSDRILVMREGRQMGDFDVRDGNAGTRHSAGDGTELQEEPPA